MRDRVDAGQPRVPLAYFQSSLPAAPGWGDTAAAYLAFGDTYAEACQQAGARDSPVKTLPGRHLHMLIEPAQGLVQ